MHATNLRIGHFGKVVQIVSETFFNGPVGDVVLHQERFKFFEKRTSVVPPLRLQPVLGIEENFLVCLPYPVVFHPGPTVFINSTWGDSFFCPGGQVAFKIQ